MTDFDFTLGEPEALHQNDFHSYVWLNAAEKKPEPIARITVESLSEKSGALHGEIQVWWMFENPDSRPIAGPAVVNLQSAGATAGWRGIARNCEDSVAGVNWMQAMQRVISDTIEAHRAGSPSVQLGTGDLGDYAPHILAPWISSSGTSIMYGQGGLSKSLILLAQMLVVSTGTPIFGVEPEVTGPCVYFDYEDDDAIHNLRLQAICKPLGINPKDVPIFHKPLISKVASSIPVMRRTLLDRKAVLAGLDSIGMGRGGDAFGPDETVRMFRSLKSLGVPFMAVDHIAKMEKKQQAAIAAKGEVVDAYGSAYTMNSTRLAWWLRPVTDESDVIKIQARNTKANHVRRHKPIGIVIRYENNAKGVPEQIHVNLSDEWWAEEVTTVDADQRMVNWLLANGQGSYDDIATGLGLSEPTLRKVVSRDNKRDKQWFHVTGTKPKMIRLNPLWEGSFE